MISYTCKNIIGYRNIYIICCNGLIEKSDAYTIINENIRGLKDKKAKILVRFYFIPSIKDFQNDSRSSPRAEMTPMPVTATRLMRLSFRATP